MPDVTNSAPRNGIRGCKLHGRHIGCTHLALRGVVLAAPLLLVGSDVDLQHIFIIENMFKTSTHGIVLCRRAPDCGVVEVAEQLCGNILDRSLKHRE